MSDYDKRRERELKLKLCFRLQRSLKSKAWNAVHAAGLLGTSRSVISLVLNSRVERLTFNQLMRFLIKIEPRVDILIAV